MKKMKQFELSRDQGSLFIDFFNNAYQDYLASRQLILNDLLIQGCIFANTSIEKYFKGIKAILGEEIPRHHDITVNKFKNTFKNKFPLLYKDIDFEFLKLLTKSYKLRYLDEINPPFNMVIPKRKILAELDYTVILIEESFKVQYGDPKKMNRYRDDRQNHNEILWKSNHILNSEKKEDFLNQKEKVLELRKLENGFLLEVFYETEQSRNDKIWLQKALTPNEKIR